MTDYPKNAQESDQIPESEPVDSQDLLDPEDNEPSQETALTNLLAELGGSEDILVNIYRQPGNGKQRMEYLFTVAPDDYQLGPLLEKVRDEYGGGQYRIRVYQNGGLIANRPISIGEPKFKKVEEKTGSEFVGIIQELMNEQRKNTELLLARLENSQKATAPPLDIMSILAMAKDMFFDTRQIPVPVPAPDTLGQLERLMALQSTMKNLGGNGDGNTSESDVLVELIRQFAPTLAQANEREKEALAITKAKQAQQPEKDNPMKAQLVMLNGIAARNLDPADYAGLVINAIPDEKQLREFIGAPDSMSKLIKIHPPIADNIAWFDELSDIIKVRMGDMPQADFDAKYLTPEPEPDNTTVIEGEPVSEQNETVKPSSNG